MMKVLLSAHLSSVCLHNINITGALMGFLSLIEAGHWVELTGGGAAKRMRAAKLTKTVQRGTNHYSLLIHTSFVKSSSFMFHRHWVCSHCASQDLIDLLTLIPVPIFNIQFSPLLFPLRHQHQRHQQSTGWQTSFGWGRSGWSRLLRQMWAGRDRASP